VQALLKAMFDGIREDFGHPVKLIRLLDEHPDIRISLDDPTPCIAVRSIVQWHELGDSHPYYGHYLSRHDRGTLMGWKQRDKYSYGSFLLNRPEYAQIGQCRKEENSVCDITDVAGFSASKSDLQTFRSTDEMVETNSREMIDEITLAKLARNLAHREIRIIHAPGSDRFERYAWDGRRFLINSGGSHHFAAAKYIAARLNEPVPLRGTLHTYSLNAVAIASLRRDFEMFAISDDAPVSVGFHDAMEAFRATWLWHPMPRPFTDAKAILLPRNERRSMQVAALLRQAGVADLGAHLARLAAAQTRHC
jgi:hypothetical protein